MLKSKKSKIITLVLVVVVLFGTIFAVPQVRNFIFSGFNADNTTSESDKDEARNLEVGKAMYGGDKDQVIKIYNDSIAATSDSKEKALLYVRKAESLSGTGDNKAALEAALEAEKLHSDMGTITMIATLYGILDDKKSAALYYRKAVTYLEQNPSYEQSDRVNVDVYRQKAEELEKG